MSSMQCVCVCVCAFMCVCVIWYKGHSCAYVHIFPFACTRILTDNMAFTRDSGSWSRLVPLDMWSFMKRYDHRERSECFSPVLMKRLFKGVFAYNPKQTTKQCLNSIVYNKYKNEQNVSWFKALQNKSLK